MGLRQDSTERPYSAGIALAGALAVVGLAILDWMRPYLAFRSHVANGLAFAVIMLVAPWGAVAFARDLSNKWPRRVGTIATEVVAIVALPLVLFGACDAAAAPWERISTIETGRHTVAIYLTNCGVPCSFGLVVRQEREILPGVLIVRDLDNFYPYYPRADPETEILGPDALRITLSEDGDWAPGRSRVYHLTMLP
jgi:hypothetical protein